MDKKKLIGTIIGVLMFAILIAGATFAFLIFNASVTNATYNGTTMNFIVDYTRGADISNLPQLLSATPETASSLMVRAAKNEKSIDGNLTIKLSTTSNNDITKDGTVNWVLCKGECTSDFSDAKASGKITAGGTEAEPSTITLWTDPELINTNGTEYYVYFWLDTAAITNSHLDETYSGYIHASATQVQS